MTYTAPIKEMLFVMNELANLDAVSALPGCEDATRDTAEAVLEENAKFVSGVIEPLNHAGDKEPSYWHDGNVTTTKGFKEAFRQFADAGWQGLQHPQDFGGQGLPKLIGTPCVEMLHGANLSFALVALLSDGAIEALMTAGSDEQKATYLEPLVTGKWTGTMNLTEPQAGSDLAAVRTRAEPQGDGTYKIFGTKIFITYGEHDMTENIVHLVLARTPDAPPGVKGISLFIVPKFLVNADGSLGARNDAHCVSIEHKLGIKASPTAVLQFGDNGGAIGTLVGEENRGLEYMFIMMNAARFGVGMQGVGLAENAYQKAVAFARDRVQSRDVAGSSGPVAIIHHPDVRRMLMSMRAQTEAARALAYVGAGFHDIAHHHEDEETRAAHQAVYEYLVPIIKGWSTEVGRKTLRDGGKVAKHLLAQARATGTQLGELAGDDSRADFAVIRARLEQGAADLEAVVDFVLANAKTDVKAVFAGSVPYLKLAGIVLGGWQMARAALIAQQKLSAGDGDAAFYKAKIATARFFADHFVAQSAAMRTAIVDGAAGVLALPEEMF